MIYAKQFIKRMESIKIDVLRGESRGWKQEV